MAASTTTILKSVLSMLGLSKPITRTNSTSSARRTAEVAAVQVVDEEHAFLTSIAELTPEEQYKRIQRRDWYARLAERQAIAEMEQRVDQYYRNSSLR